MSSLSISLPSPAISSGEFARDVRAGLTARPKTLPPKWFYDALGSVLFEAICRLPEYYLTRAESEILETHADAIVAACKAPLRLVELGSGSSAKTRRIIDAIFRRQPRLDFVTVDIDPTMLDSAAQLLVQDYDGLSIEAVEGDFLRPSAALAGQLDDSASNLVLFLGSTIGNLDRGEAVSMLSDLRSALRPGDAMLLGADLLKAREVLEPAYDDPLGVTAAFNLNLLKRINAELRADFDLRAFAHRALLNEEKSRIEMHLVSRKRQTVRIDALDLEVSFDEGESIHTENSYKYSEEMVRSLTGEAGFEVARVWTDGEARFADVLLVVR